MIIPNKWGGLDYARPLRELLLAETTLHDIVDLSGVSEIDTAGQQLLIAAKIRAMALGTTLRVIAHSPAVVEVLDLCRLGGFFGDPVLIAESE